MGLNPFSPLQSQLRTVNSVCQYLFSEPWENVQARTKITCPLMHKHTSARRMFVMLQIYRTTSSGQSIWARLKSQAEFQESNISSCLFYGRQLWPSLVWIFWAFLNSWVQCLHIAAIAMIEMGSPKCIHWKRSTQCKYLRNCTFNDNKFMSTERINVYV